MTCPCHGHNPGSNPGCRISLYRNFYKESEIPSFSFGPVAQSGLERWSYKTTFGTTLGKPEVWGSNQMVTLI